MSVTIKVNGTSNSLVHKGSNGISTATIPDVCKTPTPGGPVPIPYPNISMSSDLANGTTTVKADGGNMIAIKGSDFSMSTGDEPGTVGGVKSNTFKKESTWILYSFDVKLDGQNACRLTDKKFQNHENTADLAGIIQVPVLGEQPDPECTVACAIVCCDNAKYQKDKHADSPPKTGEEMDCTSLSRTKHSCVLHSLRGKTDSGALTTKNKFKNIQASPPGLEVGGASVIPDVIVNGNHVIDCKFPCEKPAAPLKNQKHQSKAISNTEMDTSKEDTIYSQIEVGGQKVKKSEAMTPKDAEKRMKDKGCKKCKCDYEDV